MNQRTFLPFLAAVLLAAGFYGCDGSKPTSPHRVVALTVAVPGSKEITASLLGSSQNEILYSITSPMGSPITGTSGVFSSSALSGEVQFNVEFSPTGTQLLALQLNDAASHQPLAVGAAPLSFLSLGSSSSDVVVEMGSVTRTCYYTNNVSYLGASYAFENDNLTGANGPAVSGTGYDISVVQYLNGYEITDAQGATLAMNTVAYMGNGDLVNFATVPPDASFFTDSYSSKSFVLSPPIGPPPSYSLGTVSLTDDVEVGDVYCIKLGSPVGGHAWMQVTDAGVTSVSGPNFRFRVNGSLPYYAYDRTNADLTNGCSTSW